MKCRTVYEKQKYIYAPCKLLRSFTYILEPILAKWSKRKYKMLSQSKIHYWYLQNYKQAH